MAIPLSSAGDLRKFEDQARAFQSGSPEFAELRRAMG